MSAKQRFAILTALLFVLGGGVGSAYLLAFLLGRYNPAFGSRPVCALETTLGIPYPTRGSGNLQAVCLDL